MTPRRGAPVVGTTMVRRQLGRRLTALRERAGLTREELSHERLLSQQTIWRIETGQVQVKEANVLLLCRRYGASRDETDVLCELALATTHRGWWSEYDGRVVPSWFGLFLDLERSASQVRAWEPELIPGLLQVPGYTTALFDGAIDETSPDIVDRQVTLRSTRRKMLTRERSPVRLSAVLSAGALHRQVGGPAVMAEQRALLVTLARRDNVDIRILPFDRGAHPAMVGSFTILDFPDPDDPPVAYLEAPAGGASYPEDPVTVSRYRLIFDRLLTISVPIKEFT